MCMHACMCMCSRWMRRVHGKGENVHCNSDVLQKYSIYILGPHWAEPLVKVKPFSDIQSLPVSS